MITKFRAWDKKLREMLRVVSINFDERFIRGLAEVESNLDIESSYKFDEIELLQSTGLKDKNGTEIFEGDIVTAMSEGYKATGVVKRRFDGYWLMYPAYQNGQSWTLAVNEQGDTDVEIIGSKFTHPHLLEEDTQ